MLLIVRSTIGPGWPHKDFKFANFALSLILNFPAALVPGAEKKVLTAKSRLGYRLVPAWKFMALIQLLKKRFLLLAIQIFSPPVFFSKLDLGLE
jgi:hypothetical protein